VELCGGQRQREAGDPAGFVLRCGMRAASCELMMSHSPGGDVQRVYWAGSPAEPRHR